MEEKNGQTSWTNWKETTKLLVNLNIDSLSA